MPPNPHSLQPAAGAHKLPTGLLSLVMRMECESIASLRFDDRVHVCSEWPPQGDRRYFYYSHRKVKSAGVAFEKQIPFPRANVCSYRQLAVWIRRQPARA